MLKNSSKHKINGNNKKITNQKIEDGFDNIPEFKPGNTPHLHYGKEILNKSQDWAKIISEILVKNYTIKMISEYVEVKEMVIRQALKGKYYYLDFRAGARIATLHARCYPQENGYYIE